MDEQVRERFIKVENRMDKMEEELKAQGKTDVAVLEQMKALRNDYASLKADVLLTVKEHTDRTWKLINTTFKVIMVLISIIVAFAGLKLGPEIFNSLITWR